ncbi:MAG: Xaa-Pro peptidase family protein [Christensenellaceae bacterium]|jgi:Xaa-Pro aminopeptidase|nr:Xaa-Pro peptidase family protein [Christensenellaceae bacterium]
MNEGIFEGRIRRTQAEMQGLGVDLFVAGASSNLFYLTGYPPRGDERLLALVLPKEGEPFFIANLLYRLQVERLPIGEKLYWADGENPYALLKAALEERGFKVCKVALEASLPARFALAIQQSLPGSSFVLGDALTEGQRLIKDESELRAIRRASAGADEALRAVLKRGREWIGKTEREFSEALTAEMRALGLEAYGALIAVGPGAAEPHHRTSDVPIEDGSCLLADFGGRVEGYCSDITRTVHFGKPEPEFEKVYHIVLEAHLRAEAAARPGSSLGEVDDAAREYIAGQGYGEFFTHRLGHGIGLDVHEGPSAVHGEKTVIHPGMVFSNEPGIYLPGRFGVRIENLLAACERGAEALNHFPRELIVLD